MRRSAPSGRRWRSATRWRTSTTSCESERGVALPARIGIHTGPVVVGTVGNDLKMDYTAIGDTTNLAARLESLATPGTILISEATARLVRGFFRLRQVGPLTVKGKSEPVTAFEVIGGRERGEPDGGRRRARPDAVGRPRRGAGAARRLLPAAAPGTSPRWSAVVGDAGSGKSRVIYEFKQRLLDERRAGAASSRGAARRSTRPCRCLRSSPCCGSTSSSWPATTGRVACAKVERAPRQGAAERRATPIRCSAACSRCPPTCPPTCRSKRSSRRPSRRSPSWCSSESRRAPVVMILEDLHWIDEPSQRAAGDGGRPPDARAGDGPGQPPARVPADVAHQRRASTQLHPAAAARRRGDRASRARWPAARCPTELEARILAKAEGSPFFAEEITRSLHRGGLPHRATTAACALTRPVDEILIPGTVREVHRRAARPARRPPPSGWPSSPPCSAASSAAASSRSCCADEQVDVDHELARADAAAASSTARACSPTTSTASARA